MFIHINIFLIQTENYVSTTKMKLTVVGMVDWAKIVLAIFKTLSACRRSCLSLGLASNSFEGPLIFLPIFVFWGPFDNKKIFLLKQTVSLY